MTAHSFPDLQKAAHGLLLEAVGIANEAGLPYVVVGGWSPYLLNSNPVRHPGTRDVDLLFQDASSIGTLRDVVTRFVDAGYVHSAKHEFQLLREIMVGGRKFIYNIDLLNPTDDPAQTNLFVDHLELPVPAEQYRDDLYTVKSIMIPHAEFLFNGHIVSHQISGLGVTGNELAVSVPLMSEVGTVITKSQSCLNRKRPRDAFDIFLAVAQARDYQALTEAVRAINRSDLAAFNTLFKIKEALDLGVFQVNAMMIQAEKQWTVDSILAAMTQFFVDVNLPEKAQSP